MEESRAIEIFTETKARLTNVHVLLASGLHAGQYVNKDAVYPHTAKIAELCQGIAEHFKNSNVEVVVAPAVGGVILSQWVAYHLSLMTGREVLGIYADKEGAKGLAIKRNYDILVPGKNVLVVDDVLTTGGSVLLLVEAVKALNGQVIGVGILWNRGDIKASDVGDVPDLFALVNIKIPAWSPSECPLCNQGIPFSRDIGRGKDLPPENK